MDYLSHNIGVNLKRIRKSKGMSLDIVAEQTGVSKSMLAQIEKGNANPSIGVLGKIVSGLRLDFNDLIETPPLDSFIVRVNEMIPTKEMLGNYKVWTCFPIEDNHMVEIYRIDIEPDGVYTSGSHGEKTREYINYVSEIPAMAEEFVPSMLVEKLKELNAMLGIPACLREVGVTEDAFDAMAEDAMKSGNILVNPRSSKKQDILDLYHKAF